MAPAILCTLFVASLHLHQGWKTRLRTQGAHAQEEVGREFFWRNCCQEKFKMLMNKRKRGREEGRREEGKHPLWNHSRAQCLHLPTK